MNEAPSSRFSNAGEVEQLDESRRLNFWSYLAAVLGVVSASILISPFMVVVPLLALAFGAVAIWAVRRQPELGGRMIGWVGIALALFFLAWAASEYTFKRFVLFSESYGVARDWLQLVTRGEKEIAHQGMMSINRRQSAELSVDQYYAMDEEASKQMEEAFALSPLPELMAMGEGVTIKLTKNVQITQEFANTRLEQVFLVTPQAGDPIEVKIDVIRRPNANLDQPSWIVALTKVSEESSPTMVEKVSAMITRAVAK